MVYLIYSFFTFLFIFYTPIFGYLVDFVKNNSTILLIIAIFGDTLYMIGGGIVAGEIVNAKTKFFSFTLINNYAIIMIVIGATIREYFKIIRTKGEKWKH